MEDRRPASVHHDCDWKGYIESLIGLGHREASEAGSSAHADTQVDQVTESLTRRVEAGTQGWLGASPGREPCWTDCSRRRGLLGRKAGVGGQRLLVRSSAGPKKTGEICPERRASGRPDFTRNDCSKLIPPSPSGWRSPQRPWMRYRQPFQQDPESEGERNHVATTRAGHRGVTRRKLDHVHDLEEDGKSDIIEAIDRALHKAIKSNAGLLGP